MSFNRLIVYFLLLPCAHFYTPVQLQGEEPPSSDDIKEEHAVEVHE
jgi:hypothetical protein